MAIEIFYIFIICLGLLLVSFLFLYWKYSKSLRKLKKLTRKLEEKNKIDIKVAYEEGMAEIAASVLHNIGNIVTGLTMRIENNKTLNKLPDLQKILVKYNSEIERELAMNNLNNFFNSDEGKVYKELPSSLCEMMGEMGENLDSDFSFFEKQYRKISDIITLQRSYLGKSIKFRSEVNVAEVIKDAISMQRDSFFKGKIRLSLNLKDIDIYISKVGLSQAILNFIVNAKESIDQKISEGASFEPFVKVVIYEEKGFVIIKIEDNGNGITLKENKELFKLGFSTKNRSSGFGLHHCYNFVKSNEGTLELKSEGHQKGACLILKFPKLQEKKIA